MTKRCGVFVNLSSEASLNVYPRNHGGAYRVILAKPLFLTTSHKVALTELHYKDRDWFNVRDGENWLIFQTIKGDKIDLVDKIINGCEMILDHREKREKIFNDDFGYLMYADPFLTDKQKSEFGNETIAKRANQRLVHINKTHLENDLSIEQLLNELCEDINSNLLKLESIGGKASWKILSHECTAPNSIEDIANWPEKLDKLKIELKFEAVTKCGKGALLIRFTEGLYTTLCIDANYLIGGKIISHNIEEDLTPEQLIYLGPKFNFAFSLSKFRDNQLDNIMQRISTTDDLNKKILRSNELIPESFYSTVREMRSIKQGNYRNASELILKIRKKLIKLGVPDEDDSLFRMSITNNGYFYFTYEPINIATQKFWRIRMAPAIYKMLGIDEIRQTVRGYLQPKEILKTFVKFHGKCPVNLNAEFENFYIYSNIVTPQYVGDSLACLLKVAPNISHSNGRITKNKDGEAQGPRVISQEFRPEYRSVALTEIRDIEINIFNYTGREPIYFNSETTAVLHFIEG